MALDLLYIIIGLVLLIWSADKFVEGASGIARYFNVAPIIIGIIVVGVGTSAPEILVSALSSMEGKPELAVGNAVGSNIANIALIIGLTALVLPITVEQSLIKKEFLILLAVTSLAFFILNDGQFTRIDAAIFTLGLIFFWIFMITNALKDKHAAEIVESEVSDNHWGIGKSVTWCLVGLAILIGSSKMLVTGAVNIALALGVSELIVGLTIVAIGTSLPELAASITAVKKSQAELVIGNIIGSNIFNLIAVLPVAGFIQPFAIPDTVLTRDLPLMLCLTFGFLVVCYSTKGNGRINRIEGTILLSTFIAYQGYLIYDSI